MRNDDLTLPPAFRRLGWSNLMAQFSEQIALAAAPLAAVLLLGATASETGWLQAAQTLPFLLLAIPAGLLVDRGSRHLLMVGSEAVRSLSLVLVFSFLTLGWLTIPALAVLGFLGALGTVCYSVAAPAFVPALVPRPHLARANRLLELARSTAFVAGPAIGGGLVGWIGASAAYGLASALSLIAVQLLVRLPRDGGVATQGRNVLRELKEGAGFILHHELLRPILVTAVFFNLGWFVLQAIYVAYAVQHLDMLPIEVGVTLGTYGAGMVTGALMAPMLARRLPLGIMVFTGPFGAFCGSLLMLLTLLWPAVWVAALSFFLFGLGPILWTITTVTLRQSVTPSLLLGRVSSFVMTATFGARPLGATIGAIVVARWGVAVCLIVATLLFSIQLLVICTSGVPKLRELPEPR